MSAPSESSRADLVARVEDLEQRSVVDRELVAQLEAEGLIDRGKIAHLEEALVTCRRIGAATGILMASRKITDVEAFGLLRTASQDANRKLRDIADDVLLTGALDAPAHRQDAREG
ncbi:MAG: ANTAR domain-containing protein [Actinomycetota bacterium]|nr:ANTAR domain-containing protein [Actinomycetota bacterium]